MPKVHKKKYSDNLYIKARFKNQIITWQLTYEGEQLLKRFGLDEDKTEISRATTIALWKANYLYTENSGLSADTVSPEIEPDGKIPVSRNENELLKALQRVMVKRSPSLNINAGVDPLKETKKIIHKSDKTEKIPVRIIKLGQTGCENHSLTSESNNANKETCSKNSENRPEIHVEYAVSEIKIGMKRTACPVCKAIVKNVNFVNHLTKVHSMYVDTIKQGYISYSRHPIKQDAENKASFSTVVERSGLPEKEPINSKPKELLCPICNESFPATEISLHAKQQHDLDTTDKELLDALSPGAPKIAGKEFCYMLSQKTKIPELIKVKVLLLKKAAFLNKQEAIENLAEIFIKGEESISYYFLFKIISKCLKKHNKKLFDQECLKVYQGNTLKFKKMIEQESITVKEAEAYYNCLKLFQSYLLLLFWHIGLLKSAYEIAVVTFVQAAKELKCEDYQRVYNSITQKDNFGIWVTNTESWLKIFAGYGDEKIMTLIEELKTIGRSECTS